MAVDNLLSPPPEPDADPLTVLGDRISKLEDKGELRKLDTESKYRDLLISEVNQRIKMRYAVSCLATFVMVTMALGAAHVVHEYFVGPVVLISPSLAIVLFLAPVTSVTAITISLLVGVFRRFKDDDMEKIDAKSILSEALKISQVR